MSPKSKENQLTINELSEYLKSLGNGWRIPTVEELSVIYKSKHDFDKDEFYLCIDTDGNMNYMVFDRYGSYYNVSSDDRNQYKIRAVNDITDEINDVVVIKERRKTEYELHGFANRNEYLEFLSTEFNTPLTTVKLYASVMGEHEDFDNLLSALMDPTFFKECYM